MGRNQQPAPPSAFRFSPRPNRASEISWHDWEDSAFAGARQEGKLVFLSISAFWCHWCHVMDETTFSDSAVIDLLNSQFIPIRVDTDRRPDVNRRYNQGGWPSFAILVPSGEILIGGTYIVPSELTKLLAQVQAYYAAHQDEIRRKIEDAQLERARLVAEPLPVGGLSEQAVGNVLELLKDAYDPTYGGFNRAPKFPQVDALDFLLENYYRTREKSWLNMVTNTLDHMVAGGLFDMVAGGFFRYSTTREWAVPHYEKMLEDNARLIALFLKASQIAGVEKYGEIARRAMAYLDSTLVDRATGCYYGSQDAEEEFYLLPKEEREKSRAPLVDATIYVDWNALAATAYLNAYRVFGDEGFLLEALRILDFLWSNCRHETRGMYHLWDGRPQLPNLLPDQVRTAAAMFEAYQVTGKALYMQRAEWLAELVRRDFGDEVGGGFFDISQEGMAGNAGKLEHRDKSIEDNAEAAGFFLSLYALTDREDYRNIAGRALEAFLDDYQQYGLFSASYARAVDHFLHEPVKVTIVGRRQRAGTQKLLRESLKAYAPATAVELLDPERDAERLQAIGYATGPIPAAYICHKRTCSAPIERAEDLKPVLDSLL